MPSNRCVVIGLVGTTLDHGRGPERWERWRPTVSLCQCDDLLVHRFELLHDLRSTRLAEEIAGDLVAVSPETEVRRHTITLGDPWDFEQVYEALLDFTRGYAFEPDEEEYLLHITTATHVAQICMFLLAEARHFPAKLVQTAPPRQRTPGRATGTHRVIDLDLSKYDRIAQRFHREQREAVSFLKSGIETKNAAFNRMIEQIEHVVIHSSSPVLLTGPTGAGKSRLARRIYELKKQRRQVSGAFVEVNCATIRGDGAMSALFGHKRGAFTGAVADRPGLLRTANDGLLFLDEVGELGADEQAMLLRALEEKRFLPVGSDREAGSDFQLICGTNRDLSREVRSGGGRFREDLLARINLWTFRLPELRDRPEDIEPNVLYELEQFAARAGTRVTFNKEALTEFLRFAISPEGVWPANFRDLNAAITRMATLAPGNRINSGVVADEIARLRAAWSGEAARDDDPLDDLLDTAALAAVDPFDRVQLAEVVRVCRRSRTLSEAGRALFAASRQSKSSVNDADRLRKYLARFALSWDTVRGS
jgi:transcriptional regulatory protein RtcR